MEKERETTKLLNVLGRIARAAEYAAWYKVEPDAARFCAMQYNKVLARLTELEPAIAPLFTELAEDTRPEVVRMAAHELAAYFEDEPAAPRRGRHRARGCGGARVGIGWFAAPGRGW